MNKGTSKTLTPWKSSELDRKAGPLPLSPLREGESMSTLDKSGVFGLHNDGREGSLSQRAQRERAGEIPHASNLARASRFLNRRIKHQCANARHSLCKN
jgi:hypothetical protein